MTNAIVSASAKFWRAPDGSAWTPNQSLDYSFWTRYLDVYESITLFVRCFEVDVPPRGMYLATGPGVTVQAIPANRGRVDLLRNLSTARRVARQLLSHPVAVHLRVPCVTGTLLWRELKKHRPYGLEVVGDPAAVLREGGVGGRLGVVYAHLGTTLLRRQCRDATAVAYVTGRSLQERYPPGPETLEFSFSSASLSEIDYANPRRTRVDADRIIFVGSLEQHYKGVHVLLEAFKLCVADGRDRSLTIVGDGRLRPALESIARQSRLSANVTFTGYVSKARLRELLDEADLFVLPSLAEGLPRAMLEAMARGLPCIGTKVGGVPELLPAEAIVSPGDAAGLGAAMREVLADPGRRQHMSKRNRHKADGFRQEILSTRRRAFYEAVRERTLVWADRYARRQP